MNDMEALKTIECLKQDMAKIKERLLKLEDQICPGCQKYLSWVSGCFCKKGKGNE